MNWLDDRLKQRDEAVRRSVAIESQAESIYNNLWDEVARWVQEAQDRGISVLTNGSPYERVLVLSPRRAGDAKRLVIRLEKGKHAIMVGPLQLDIDLCEDGVVCLKRNGERLEVGSTAERILDMFLFPELAVAEARTKGRL